ncbi:vesicle transport V-snare protein vti1a, putative [Entamoeba invadens IP1]|uniref:Vesicle transport V-snare protein vti1a, putative n=1 Tax=Entamoeba invadens IP1 TaxID=370355 RepID=A0A0A1UF28_ENTIV|nr:vesicle transport V-snare protein vti1a, putative [Entamoeba invadens IP1]ELP92568.1 vesicle transport V-snare protein vti1a, putative [Entamoeba invadens IP1]|eukprot:XP_004259339.1 vesicle transport V-snare protein vti1a, putative [Entamoeba invadens IP1]
MGDNYNQAQQLLQKQNAMLDEALSVGYENEQIGAETHQMLVGQREQLHSVNDKLDNIDTNVTVADSKLKRMTFRLITDKIVQIVIIVLLVLAILLVIFIKWIAIPYF